MIEAKIVQDCNEILKIYEKEKLRFHTKDIFYNEIFNIMMKDIATYHVLLVKIYDNSFDRYTYCISYQYNNSFTIRCDIHNDDCIYLINCGIRMLVNYILGKNEKVVNIEIPIKNERLYKLCKNIGFEILNRSEYCDTMYIDNQKFYERHC